MHGPSSFDLVNTYVNLSAGGVARTVEGGAAFWKAIAEGRLDPDVVQQDARLIAVFDVTHDWTSWEVHPAGEELVYVISGSMDLLLEESTGVRTLTLESGQGCLVARGIWHTANGREPAKVLHVTPGTGTAQRPRT